MNRSVIFRSIAMIVNNYISVKLCLLWIILVGQESSQSSVIIVQDDNCDPCYRKLLSGKRLADSHVRRNVQCARIEECHRVCEYESGFVCEGFNYGRAQQAGGLARQDERSYMCQLTSLSPARMDPRRDFVHDPHYDYYERDWRCPAKAPGGGGGRDWPSTPHRPLYPHQSPRRPPNELPGPSQRPNDRWPVDYSPAPANPLYYPAEKSRPDYYYYSGEPQRPQSERRRPPQGPPYLPDYYYSGSDGKFPERRTDQSWRRQGYEPYERDWRGRPSTKYLPNKDWGGSDVYGPSYGYDSNVYEGKGPHRGSEDFYPGRDKPRKNQRRPSGDRDYYGDHYGPAYGYEEVGRRPVDSYLPIWKPNERKGVESGPWGGSRDCSVRSATGFKVTRRIVGASYTAGNLEECEMLCVARGDCQSFAYRYSLAATAPTDNCLLSNVHFSKLDFYIDLEPDRDYDIYKIINDLGSCRGSRKAEPRPNHRPSDECFWRVQSGFGIPVSLIRKELRVDNGLGECQSACVSASHFTCRSFVFRYDFDRDRGPNCFLSDCPSSEIIASGSSAGLPRIDQAELYERGSYGRGCEINPFATIYNPSDFGKPKPWTESNHVGNRGDKGCYSSYQSGCKLSPYAVSSMTRVDSEAECRRKCSRMRNNPHSPCMSFSFKIGDEKRGDNCYLSDVPRRDLRPGLDYVYDDDYVMYAWKELESQCSLGPVGNPHNGGFQGYPGSWPTGGQSNHKVPHLGPGTGLYSYNHLVSGAQPLDADRPDPIPPDYPSYLPGPQNGDGYSPDFGSPYPGGMADFNRHYTVNGMPCKRGTKCERNQLVGFWSCEPEGSELGSWDYCCEPNHHCGFSQGYNYPWCYVGPSEEQWRPCSDKYSPYLPSPRPALRPSKPDDRRPLYQHPGQPIYCEEPSTYLSRHWPIAFLHPEPPPNSTDSVALANDRRDDSPATNHTSTAHPAGNTTQAPSTEMTNSPITRLQLHKSHLKRRGLVTNNRTLSIARNGANKIRRISIIPADPTPSYGAKHATEKPLDPDNNDNRTKATRRNDAFEVIHLAASLPEVERTQKWKSNLGRVERITKPTSVIRIENKVDNQTRVSFSQEFTNKRPVYVPVTLRAPSNNSSRAA